MTPTGKEETGELLLRDAPLDWSEVLQVCAVGALLFAVREWLWQVRRPHRLGVFEVAMLLALVLMPLRRLTWMPVWVRVDVRGISFRDSSRHGRYRWREIERIEVGNPAKPLNAYLVLEASRTAVELPHLASCPPAEMVGLLRDRWRRALEGVA